MSEHAPPSLIDRYLPMVEAYVAERCWQDLPHMDRCRFEVRPLAQGEYNLNYLLSSPSRALVFRINIGTQIGRSDQILYEYRALELLAASGCTPRPFFVDDSRTRIDRGILIMEYLPGRPLDYLRDLEQAALLFARIHQLDPPDASSHLIHEERPLGLIVNECSRLLARYFASPLADAAIAAYLEKLLEWADRRSGQDDYFRNSPWNCIVNTEVNAGNFIVNDQAASIHLIDWEMPRWDDPSTDLCHFCSPLTTLWKTDYRMDAHAQNRFLQCYRAAIRNRELAATLDERIALKMPFILLRGISWSAMGWVAYQTDYQGIRNEHTWQTLQRYLDLDFIRSLFKRHCGF